MSDLGRRVPPDFVHVQKYGIRTALPDTVARVERTLALPNHLRPYYDQGEEGACVGFALSWMMSILNRTPGRSPKYDANWLYEAAQLADSWPETPPEEGTSVRAGCDILRGVGHRVRYRSVVSPPHETEGIMENRWATQVDEIRTAIAEGIPVVIGVNWYNNFDFPEPLGRSEWQIGKDDLGPVRGGHAVCLYGASDRRQAVKIVNSWGRAYPLVWMPYDVLQRLLYEYGEATIVTDRA